MNSFVNYFGDQFWYDDNHVPHRDDGPAIIYNNFDKSTYWIKHGKYHRLDGPAIFDQDPQWWIEGIRINCSTNEEFLRIVKLKALL
jgi:hypothetical protein